MSLITINHYSRSAKGMNRLLQEHLPDCQILVTDITPIERPFAFTLQERCFIYKSSHVKQRMPVTVGHNYSFVCALPQKKMWTCPLSIRSLASLHLPVKILFFGIFIVKFFDNMLTYVLKI